MMEESAGPKKKIGRVNSPISAPRAKAEGLDVHRTDLGRQGLRGYE